MYNPSKDAKDKPKIGRYVIECLIGKGGMAAVYRAYDPHFHRQVAIKVLPREFLFDDTFRQRFQREAQAIAALEHPSIVPVHDYGEENGQPYLVMRYMPGGSLEERLEQGRMTLEEASALISRLAPALDEAHSQGIIHRDLKPGNILFDRRGEPHLSDFGIVKLTEATTTLTAGAIIGTPAYMSPEQGRGEKDIDGRTDIYSLGAILFQMLSGKLPYEADTPTGQIMRHIMDPIPNLLEVSPTLPAGIQTIIERSMAKKKEQRYSTTEELAQELSAVIEKQKQMEIEKPVDKTIPSEQAFQAEATLAGEDITIPKLTQPSEALAVEQQAGKEASEADLVRRESISPAVPDEEYAGKMLEQPLPSIVAPPLPKKKAHKRISYIILLSVLGLIAVGILGGGAALLINRLIKGNFPALVQNPTYTPELTLTPQPVVQSSTIDGMVMVYIPAGDFRMGSYNSDALASEDEKPHHRVYLDAFWIDQTEVTNAMYALCVQAGACQPPQNGEFSNPEYEKYPVIYVNWNDAKAYCEWAGRRLSTEAEWEKAARGTDERIYPGGKQAIPCKTVNFESCVGFTAQVGSYPAGISPYGALDMAGNVAEWVLDWYESNYYSHSPFMNPSGPDVGEERVLRGGAWNSFTANIRTASRDKFNPTSVFNNIGFRCARPAILTSTEQPNTVIEMTPTPVPGLGIGSTYVSEIDGMTLVYVPGGEFLMGSADSDTQSESDEKPQHTVYLDAFWIDKTEVTNAMYNMCVQAGACRPPSNTNSFTIDSYFDNPKYNDYPVIWVSWNNAKTYCQWAERRLPSEAEWEKAARGTEGGIYPWGNTPVAGNLANFCDKNCPLGGGDPNIDDGYADTSPVGNYSAGASPYGALDMAGNVWEWVADWYGADYYDRTPVENPSGPEAGKDRVARGGCWHYSKISARSAERGWHSPDGVDDSLGFRCARSP